MQNTRLKQLTNIIYRSERNMRQSPQKELQLAKLQRDRDSKSQVYSSVLLRYNEIKTAHASVTPDAYLLESAQLPIIHSNIFDSILKLFKISIGPILGLAIAIGIFIGLDFLWHRARSVDDIEGLLKLPVLGTIPLLKTNADLDKLVETGKKMDPLLVTIDYTPSLAGDAFRNVRTRLILNKDKNDRQQLIITSLMPNEGKSLIASNLAITFAQLKKQTLLIDTDMRRGVIHNSFLCNKKPGLADILGKGIEINQDKVAQFIQKTTVPNLYLITSGSSIPNPTELLIDNKIEKVLDILKRQFHYIIIDTPPIEFIPDAFVINKNINKMLIVTRYGKTNLNQLKKKLFEFDNLSDSINGIVLNASPGVLEKKYQAYSYYKY
jgi:tyrosine-protein kinase Etk/Wzc